MMTQTQTYQAQAASAVKSAAAMRSAAEKILAAIRAASDVGAPSLHAANVYGAHLDRDLSSILYHAGTIKGWAKMYPTAEEAPPHILLSAAEMEKALSRARAALQSAYIELTHNLADLMQTAKE